MLWILMLIEILPTISADSLNITADNTALNTGTIVSGSLDVITADFFRNLAGGDI